MFDVGLPPLSHPPRRRRRSVVSLSSLMSWTCQATEMVFGIHAKRTVKKCSLVGGFNPSEKYQSNWKSSPGGGWKWKKIETTSYTVLFTVKGIFFSTAMNQRPRYERHFRTRGWDGCFVVFGRFRGSTRMAVSYWKKCLAPNDCCCNTWNAYLHVQKFTIVSLSPPTLLGCPAGT